MFLRNFVSIEMSFLLMFLFSNFVSKGTTALFLDRNKFDCERNTTVPGNGIKVIHSKPFRENGTVIFEASLIRQFAWEDPMCKWSYDVEDIIDTKSVELSHSSSLRWIFSKPGLKKVSVTAEFQYLGKEQRLTNCTFVNVTDCELKLGLVVSTSSGQKYNIDQKHSNVYMDAPGQVDFKLSILKVDMYFVCRDLSFLWDFGDGSDASGKHVSHYYNNTGVFFVIMQVFDFFEDLDHRRFMRNITMKININDCPLKAKIMVATSSGSYNISQNHTDVFMNAPGLVRFNLSISKVQPYSICKDLFIFWDFGDGDNATGKHVQHHYNNTGTFSVVMRILKGIEYLGQRRLIRNITMKIHIKVKHDSSQSSNTVIDVSLVLAIFFTCFVFVLCIAAYWFRKRLHRHIEVARFDFRASELQSSYDYADGAQCSGKVLNGKGCINSLSCRRGSTENLLNFAPNKHYSSCERFGGKNLHEDL
ncbi:uncharacterized protein LOC114519420 [Dendronephthya gigantea]|uniref:uncharacterized protein LOC114519420 n=1 Tax=Dendronephthya gigantea TaxID=151771 RepID=UPI00106DCD9D|nr:uncharacterized protein LOC114519420 [Dendronephthya gigantea]